MLGKNQSAPNAGSRYVGMDVARSMISNEMLEAAFTALEDAESELMDSERCSGRLSVVRRVLLAGLSHLSVSA